MTAAVVFLAVAGVLVAAKLLLRKRLAVLATRTSTQIDDALVALFAATNVIFIVVVALQAASSALTLPTPATRVMGVISILALALQAGLWGRAAVRSITRGYIHRQSDAASRTAVFAAGFLAQGIIWAFVFVAALTALGYNVTALLTGLGIGGIAIALAVQNILGDLFAALSIVVDKPFLVGETIDVDGQVGTVEKIGLKTTRVRALQGEEVVFSNADLLKARVRNYARMRERRIVMTISLAPETPVAVLSRIPGIIREIVQQQPNVRFDRAHFARLANASMDFELVFFSLNPDFNVGMDLQQGIYLALLRRFESERIQLAIPTRVIIQRTDQSAPAAAEKTDA
ncbi:MAG: mechanosensitive ion channel family protein [Gemmatimonadota bacterium]